MAAKFVTGRNARADEGSQQPSSRNSWNTIKPDPKRSQPYSTSMTLASASSMDKDFNAYGGNIDAAKKVGEAIAKKCLEKGITEVVYDRGGFVYHGRVQALAEGAREAGLKL